MNLETFFYNYLSTELSLPLSVLAKEDTVTVTRIDRATVNKWVEVSAFRIDSAFATKQAAMAASDSIQNAALDFVQKNGIMEVSITTEAVGVEGRKTWTYVLVVEVRHRRRAAWA